MSVILNVFFFFLFFQPKGKRISLADTPEYNEVRIISFIKFQYVPSFDDLCIFRFFSSYLMLYMRFYSRFYSKLSV